MSYIYDYFPSCMTKAQHDALSAKTDHPVTWKPQRELGRREDRTTSARITLRASARLGDRPAGRKVRK